jgi:hypothetical protein
MKKLLLVVISLLFLFGCQDEIQKSKVTTESSPINNRIISNELEPIKPDSSTYFANSEEFDRVIGWVSESEILFIEINNEGSHVYTYDLNQNKKTHQVSVDRDIIDVEIHPTKSHFVLIMSDNSLQATLAIYELGGAKVDELSIESSEIVFEWHPSDINLMVVTAFYEDWTFDTFTYSSETQEMQLLSTTQPFFKWSSQNLVVGVEWQEGDALSGGTLIETSLTDGTSKESNENNYIFVDYFDNLSLTVQINQVNELFIYTLRNLKTGQTKIFESPAISNYSQWFIPEIIWTNHESFLTFTSTTAGLLDTNQANLELVEFNFEGQQNLKVEEVGYSQTVCSPSGVYCLMGDGLSMQINLSNGEKKKWIEYKSE